MGISMFDPKSDNGLFRAVNNPENLHLAPSHVDVPVVIIGGGPAGLLQAHLLSQLGGRW